LFVLLYHVYVYHLYILNAFLVFHFIEFSGNLWSHSEGGKNSTACTLEAEVIRKFYCSHKSLLFLAFNV